MEGPSAEVGAVISDLETEYERSQKFLADLCRSLEARGVMKRPGAPDRLEDKSPFITMESDAPVVVPLQNTAASVPLGAVHHRREGSELSNCSDGSASIAPLPEPNGDFNRSPGTNYSPGTGCNNDHKHQRRGDVPSLPTSSSPLRSRTSARAGRKPSNVSSSCPCMNPSQDDNFDRVRHSGGHLDFGTLQKRASGLGSIETPPLSQLLVPPQLPVGNARHRHSSLDFVPAAHSHTRKWYDNSLLASQQQQHQQQHAPLLLASPQQPLASYELGGHTSCQAPVRRGSLELFGSPRTATAAVRSASAANYNNNNHDTYHNTSVNSSNNASCNVNPSHSHSYSAAAPAPATAASSNTTNNGIGGCGAMSIVGGSSSILSRSSNTLGRRFAATPPSHSHSHSQHQMLQQQQQPQPGVSVAHFQVPPTLSQQQLEPLQLQLSLPLESPGATTASGYCSAPLAIIREPLMSRRATESGALRAPSTPGSPSGSVSGGHSGPLPPLQPPTPTSPTSLPLNLTSPGARGASAADREPAGGGSPSSPGISPSVAHFRRGSSNGALQPSGASGPHEAHWVSSEALTRSGRFSRCGQAAFAVGTGATANAVVSGPTPPSVSTVSAAAAAAMLHQGAASDRGRRALSSGELPERLVPRTTLVALTGGGSNAGGSPLGRHESGGGGGGAYGSPMVSRRGSELGGGGAAAADAHAPRGAIAAAAICAPDLPWQNGHPQQQQYPNVQYHPVQQQQQHHPHGGHAPTLLSAGVGLRPETRTRLGPAGAAAGQQR